MRKIVAALFVSLDGVAESPEKWHFPYFNDEMGAIIQTGMEAADTMLLGRNTYEGFAAYWPNSDDPMAAYMNGARKVVVSTTLASADWENSTLISDDVYARIAALKAEPGGDISITGSVTLVDSLLREGLIDELVLLVHPIVKGTGKRVFAGIDGDVPLALVSSTTLKTGVVALTYGPAPTTD